MTTSDWIAGLSFVVASCALFLQLGPWFYSRPRLKLSIIADAVEMPPTVVKKPMLALTVTNRGSEPTTLTHMIMFIYPTSRKFFRGKPTKEAFLPNPVGPIPHELGPNNYWIGQMVYDQLTTEARSKGRLYVGVYATHSNKQHLIRVPKRKRKFVEDAQAA